VSHFFIDGYNLMRATELFDGGALRDQRERLLRFIEEKRPQGAAHEVTVVFDGRSDVSSPAWPGPTRVLFSPGKDADTMIKDRVDHAGNPREAVVVTNDRAIQRWVRGVGARVMSCEEFLQIGRAHV
jgi:predicted RNA-binding protein with PIN domain